MSKLQRLKDTLNSLERAGYISIEDGSMVIEKQREYVITAILETGPWGALLLMGRLDEAIRNKEKQDEYKIHPCLSNDRH